MWYTIEKKIGFSDAIFAFFWKGENNVKKESKEEYDIQLIQAE